jgi:hypothetical protein
MARHVGGVITLALIERRVRPPPIRTYLGASDRARHTDDLSEDKE